MSYRKSLTYHSTTYDKFRHLAKLLEDSTGDVNNQLPIIPWFLRFWEADDAAASAFYQRLLEIKAKVRDLQKIHGSWSPPRDIAQYLKKRPEPPTFTAQPDTKTERNLRLILKILGCSLHANRPYKQFLKAKTIRQKRYWLHKYMGTLQTSKAEYYEHICPTRLKRLLHFFPERFEEDEGVIYFNNKVLLHDRTANLYYLGTNPHVLMRISEDSDEVVSPPHLIDD